MRKNLIILLMLISFLLVACSGAAPAMEVGAPDTAAEAEAEQPQAEKPEPTVITEKEEVSYDGPQMECTLVSSQQEAPAEFVSILGVKEDDWVRGPDTAAVTIVEYSDFQ